MKLFYSEVPGGNFGDDMNEWLWDRLLPGWRDWITDTTLVGVGTILNRDILPEGTRKLVIGAGAGYGVTPVVSAETDEWDIRAVRGPLTAASIGVSVRKAMVDPAALVSDFDEFRDVARHGQTLFVPHHFTADDFDWEHICRGTGITPLGPAGDAENVIRQIAGARRVIAESMHAAIVADTFRVPWRAVSIGGAFNQFKWEDWGQSLNMPVRILPFFPFLRRLKSGMARIHGRTRAENQQSPQLEEQSSQPERGDRRSLKRATQENMFVIAARTTLERAARQALCLSDEAVLNAKKRALWQVLDEVKRDYGEGSGAAVTGDR